MRTPGRPLARPLSTKACQLRHRPCNRCTLAIRRPGPVGCPDNRAGANLKDPVAYPRFDHRDGTARDHRLTADGLNLCPHVGDVARWGRSFRGRQPTDPYRPDTLSLGQPRRPRTAEEYEPDDRENRVPSMTWKTTLTGLFDRNLTLDVRRWVDTAPQKRHECGQRRVDLARNAKSSARGPSVEAIPPGEGHTDRADDRLPAYPASSARAHEDAAELAAAGGGRGGGRVRPRPREGGRRGG